MTNDADHMALADYLAQGGKLTSPENVPPRYRGEVLRLMASFVDSQLAGSAGIKARIAASRITLEKADHAERVLDLMQAFGTDKALYEQAHDWAARGPRDAAPEARRRGGDMRLSVFHAPLTGWTDAVVMNVLMGQATLEVLEDLARCSYQPLAEVLRDILPRERRHMELGLEGLERIGATAEARARLFHIAGTLGAPRSPTGCPGWRIRSGPRSRTGLTGCGPWACAAPTMKRCAGRGGPRRRPRWRRCG